MRVQYTEIPGVARDLGWYAADLASERRREYEEVIGMLGIPISLVFVPGKEIPMSATLRSFEAGESVTPEQFLSRLTRLRTGSVAELSEVYMASDIQRRKVSLTTGQEAFFAKAPKVPAGLPAAACHDVVNIIVQRIRDADKSELTIIMPERAGPDRHSGPEWLLHDIGHMMDLEGPEFKRTFKPLTSMGEVGALALQSLKEAGRVARLTSTLESGVDYGPQALVNMCVRGKGKDVVLSGGEKRPTIRRIQREMTREIRKRIDNMRGTVQVW